MKNLVVLVVFLIGLTSNAQINPNDDPVVFNTGIKLPNVDKGTTGDDLLIITPQGVVMYLPVVDLLSSYTETDPVYSGDPASTITQADIDNWNNDLSGGNYTAGNGINISGANVISATLGSSIQGSEVSNSTLDGSHIANNTLTSDDLASSSVLSDEIANSSVNSVDIKDGEVKSVDINQMGATNGQVLKWNGSSWQPAADGGGGGGGNQDLQSVTDVGNTTTNNIEIAGADQTYGLLIDPPTYKNGEGFVKLDRTGLLIDEGQIDDGYARYGVSIRHTDVNDANSFDRMNFGVLGGINSGSDKGFDYAFWTLSNENNSGFSNGFGKGIRLYPGGEVRIDNLSGTGNRIVVADAQGDLSTMAIPSGGGGGQTYTAGAGININGSNVISSDLESSITGGEIAKMGANDGDVLTWDGVTNTWIPKQISLGQGAAELRFKEVTLSSNDIKTNGATTLVTNPSSTGILIVERIVYMIDAGSTPFNSTTAISIYYQNGGEVWDITETYLNSPTDFYGYADGVNQNVDLNPGDNLIANMGNEPNQGNGKVILKIYYRIEEF